MLITKTNNSLYQACRKVLGTDYDHVSVVINKNEVIHISPPIISKIEIGRIVSKSREPLVFRVDFSGREAGRDTYLGIIHNFIGDKYNECAIPAIFRNEFAARFEAVVMRAFDVDKAIKHNKNVFSLQTMKYSRICSEAVLYALCRGHETLSSSIDEFVQSHTKYERLGFVLPN